MWEFVLSKVRKRLARWKGKKLSFARKLCLIKLVISAIFLLFLSFFKVPKKVVYEIVKVQRNFSYGWEAEGRKIDWVQWSKVCQQTED